MTVKSCLYYVDTGTVQMPYFGKGISLVTFDPLTYKQMEKEVFESFQRLGESLPSVSEEERKQIQREVRAKLKSPQTQEEFNDQQLDKQARRRRERKD